MPRWQMSAITQQQTSKITRHTLTMQLLLLLLDHRVETARITQGQDQLSSSTDTPVIKLSEVTSYHKLYTCSSNHNIQT